MTLVCIEIYSLLTKKINERYTVLHATVGDSLFIWTV